MKKFIKSKTILQVMVTTLVTTLAVAGIVAATSVGTDITATGDITITSGARVGTGSTGDHVTALAGDSLLVEGESEFDGITWVDGSLRASSTFMVTDASTFTGAITALSTLTVTDDLAADTDTLYVDASADKTGIGSSTPYATLSVETAAGDPMLMIGSSTAEILSLDATGNLKYDGGTLYGDLLNNNIGISSSTPSAMFSVGDGSGTSTSTVDVGIPCFRMKTYIDGVLTEVYYWPCVGAGCSISQAGGWATSTASCF
ncbi:hypothetical protein COT99_03420 [Candidatus Falkowbacteria bacterium CG10_big_fil_rev_8_21_14_0_10_43_10]|uniref:Uncharacterized protein n=1 Tax=Candidatus Falkowbacteria bacterium CG10_big_fil_rev_8_21_14_0_10_43_10 TaxID=1974567 RepID=A0A2H0V1K3_9BACT|nr:MAG: hypothetical protein COT99_03420 [Candidatus Falkowbacteria bacterium CG10_big_fil_rev_8_21_14_0_10_43_10]